MLDHIVIWPHDWKCITALSSSDIFWTKPRIWIDTHVHTDMVITIIGRSCHKYHFCGNKSSVMTNVLVMTNMFLSWQNMSFVMTKVCSLQQNLSWQIFVMINMCLWQKFCHHKHTFVMTKDMFCHDKILFVATNICCDKKFVTTKILSYFVATKIILLTAPANDKLPPPPPPVTGGIKSGSLTQQLNRLCTYPSGNKCTLPILFIDPGQIQVVTARQWGLCGLCNHKI